MDKLAEQLKTDAGRIDVQVSAELDRRIEASLRGVTPKSDGQVVLPKGRPAGFWWASSLTGMVVALAVIAVINSRSQPEIPPATTASISPVLTVAAPIIAWRAESAMLTSPLRQVLEDLQADLRKVEHKVRQDIGL